MKEIYDDQIEKIKHIGNSFYEELQLEGLLSRNSILDKDEYMDFLQEWAEAYYFENEE